MNLTLIFMFDTHRYRFHSMNLFIDNTRQSLSRFGESQIARLHAIDKSFIDLIKSRMP